MVFVAREAFLVSLWLIWPFEINMWWWSRAPDDQNDDDDWESNKLRLHCCTSVISNIAEAPSLTVACQFYSPSFNYTIYIFAKQVFTNKKLTQSKAWSLDCQERILICIPSPKKKMKQTHIATNEGDFFTHIKSPFLPIKICCWPTDTACGQSPHVQWAVWGQYQCSSIYPCVVIVLYSGKFLFVTLKIISYCFHK